MSSRLTNGSGFYEFNLVTPGGYIVEQTDLSGYETISDFDESSDDPNDVEGANNIILVTVSIRENDQDNNFRDRLITGTISGFAFDEQSNGLANISITLFDANGNGVGRRNTDANGYFEFIVVPGNYTLRQEDISGFTNISDQDESPDDINDVDEANNIIQVSLGAYELDSDNNFRDQVITGTISGFAFDSQSNGIPNISIVLFDLSGNAISRRNTDANGYYQFTVIPGTYTLRQDDINGFTNISDEDESPDDPNDVDGANNIIQVTLQEFENDADNNFRDQVISGTISGLTTIDLNGDGIGDIPFPGTSFFLLDGAGNQIETAVSDENGQYVFEGLPVGEYIVLEENIDGYADVLDEDELTDASDQDGANDVVDNRIPVTLSVNENDEGNNFVNRLLISKISGFVRIDSDADNILDAPIENVSIDLFNNTGVRQARTETDENGYYEFTGFDPGTYFLFEDQEEGAYEDLYDRDESITAFDTDGGDNVVNNQIVVILTEGEHDADNNFANFIPNVGTISGFVFVDFDNDDLGDEGIEGVLVSLFNFQNELISTRRTLNSGSFVFTDIPPGDYYLSESDRVGYDDVSDFDTTNPDDPNDVDGVNDIIYVSIDTDEVDDGNIFVNRRSQSDIIETCRQAQFDDFSLGFGDFWRSGGSRAVFVENDFFLSPSGSIQINNDTDESAILSSSQNFESVNSLKVNINYLARRAELDDHFVFEVSTDGGASFTEIRRWQINIDFINEEWNFTSVTISDDLLSSRTVLRIRSGFSSGSDLLYLDDIEIEICFDEVDDDDDGVALTADKDDTTTIEANTSVQRPSTIGQDIIQYESARKEVREASDYTLFPNPTSDYIIIQLPSNSDNERLRVALYDSSGKQVYNDQIIPIQSKLRLDVQHLDSNQLYFIQLHNGDKEMQMLRFLKIN